MIGWVSMQPARVPPADKIPYPTVWYHSSTLWYGSPGCNFIYDTFFRRETYLANQIHSWLVNCCQQDVLSDSLLQRVTDRQILNNLSNETFVYHRPGFQYDKFA